MGIQINIENYEAYLLDLAEGNLSLAEEKALVQFLAKHPELEADLEELPVLEEEGLSLQEGFKSTLLRDETTGLPERDHLMISAVEGELSEDQKVRLNDLLQSDESAQKDLAYYHKTRLKAAETAYPYTDELLKKESRLIPLWTTVSSIAAAILLMIYIGLPEEETYAPIGYSFQLVEVQDGEAGLAFVMKDDEVSEEKTADPIKIEQDEEIPSAYLADDSRSNTSKVDVKKEPRREQIDPIESQEVADLENESTEISPIQNEEVIKTEELADNAQEEASEEVVEKSEADEVLSPLEYARKLIKEDVLKNRTLAESVKAGVSNITNENVNFEQEENESQAQFALNIGKLKFRKK